MKAMADKLVEGLEKACCVLEEITNDDEHVKDFTLFDPVDLEQMDKALATSGFKVISSERGERCWHLCVRYVQAGSTA